jgi:predicted ferric reductase
MTTINAGTPALPVGAQRPSTGRALRRDLTGVGLIALLIWVTGLWVSGGGLGDLTSVAGALTSAGRITGLWASALLLVQVFLMARVPIIEQAWGRDHLVRTHRWVGFSSFSLLMAHLVLITLGYAASSSVGLWGTIVDLTVNDPGMLLAIAGTGALVMVVVTSVKAARRRLRYESWHLIHLYGYLGAGLALPHQLWTGADFLSSRAATIFWWGAYAVCAAAVVVFRLAVPLWQAVRSPLRVLSVRRDRPDVTTVTIGGAGVSRLQPRAGQFFNWRFVDGPGWSAAHPYSLSAAPDGQTLRITVAHVGDGSSRLAELEPGTRVFVEGPYGLLHDGVRTKNRVLLFGNGIGITPLRAILEDLPAGVDVVVMHRVRTRHDAVLADEVRALCAARAARLVVIEGSRIPGRHSWLPGQAAHLSDADALREVVPDVDQRSVFLCGSAGWIEAAEAACRDAGVPSSHRHTENFAL